MTAVYVASSWRNPYQPDVVKAVVDAGHSVYDFRNPCPGDLGFHWSHVDPNWKNWTPRNYVAGLEHELAVDGFNRDWLAMQRSDACIMVLPCGRSAHLEAGYFAGAGKKLIILLMEATEPELMYRMANAIVFCIPDAVAAVATTNQAPAYRSAHPIPRREKT